VEGLLGGRDAVAPAPRQSRIVGTYTEGAGFGVELLEAEKFRFLLVDRDGDGTLTSNEFEALVKPIGQ